MLPSTIDSQCFDIHVWKFMKLTLFAYICYDKFKDSDKQSFIQQNFGFGQ